MTCEEKMSLQLAEITSWNSSVQKREHFNLDITHIPQLLCTNNHIATSWWCSYECCYHFKDEPQKKQPWCSSNSPPSCPLPFLESSWVLTIFLLAWRTEPVDCQLIKVHLILMQTMQCVLYNSFKHLCTKCIFTSKTQEAVVVVKSLR